MDALLGAAQWVVGKALAPVADGVLEAWDASNNLGLNIDALRMELLHVQATLETASRKHIDGKATEQLLWKLRDSARSAEDLLDELDYFRIHDKLHGSNDAADQHAKGGVHSLALNAGHTAQAVLGLSSSAVATPAEPGQVEEDAGQPVGCCAWTSWLLNLNSLGYSSSSSTLISNQADVEEQVRGCMPKLGKLLPCSSSQHADDYNSGGHSTLCSGAPQRERAKEAPMLRFNRVDVSERMKHILEKLQPARREFTTILQSCDRITVPDIALSRPITTGQSIETKLYGRDDIVNSFIHDITKGKYHNKDLTVLPVVGPGGIGKTTLIQHIYHNTEVKNHFHARIWVCVSPSFNLNKLLEDIKKDTPPVQGEKGGRPEELIEQRLETKRFLLVLDDIWACSNEDDWKRLLLPLKTSQAKGSMILVTTRFPAVAKMVKTTDHLDLEGLESKEFRKLFLAYVFGGEPFRSDHNILLETGDKIIEKLKGSPLAAKTVGRLLRNDLNLRHWRRVLESKEWERQTDSNDIMPALKLSYDYLPFHQQQCFSSSALFPEDHNYSSTELIDLWIGLDILQPSGQNQTLQDIGLSTLTDLVTHGFFKQEETNGHPCYVMHDLLHDLALKVASHDSVCLHRSNVGSVEIQPHVCHLSIIIDRDDVVSPENFGGQLQKLKTRLNVKHLHTLMLFGEINESFAKILGDLLRDAKALRVLRLVDIPCSVEAMLHNFLGLVHLRYLCLGTKREIHLPHAISRFYHLRILDMEKWNGGFVLPRDLSNLEKLCHFYIPIDNLHSEIFNVGKLVLLEELKVFRVNKESEGFEPEQLEHLTELRELGIFNLENIHTKEEAAKAKLIEKNYLQRLTLDWNSERANSEPGVEAVVLESLQPHGYLEELCIRGHKGSSCPTWLGDELGVELLQSLHLDGVSWQCLPPLGKMCCLGKLILKHIATMKEFFIEQSFHRLTILELVGLESFEKWVPSQDASHMFPLLQVLIIVDCPKLLELPFSNRIVYPQPGQEWNIDWLPKLQKLEIQKCPELLLVAPIPWTKTLTSVDIRDVKLLQKFVYLPGRSYEHGQLSISGKDDLHSLDQVVAFRNLTGLESLCLDKCPPMEFKQLMMLTSLKRLTVENSDSLVGPIGGEVDVEWKHPVESLVVVGMRGASGKELTELLIHLPRLSTLKIRSCENLTHLAVGVDVQEQTTSAGAASSELEEEKEDGLLLLPAHLSDSLRKLHIEDCTELVLVDPSRGLQTLGSLQSLVIGGCPNFLSAISSFSCCLFPSSLQDLRLDGVKGMGTLEPLSNLTSLTGLSLFYCGEDLRCLGLGPLLTAQLRALIVVYGSPRFFAEWDPKQADKGSEEQQLVCSSKLQELRTQVVVGLLASPICSFLSSSLAHLSLYGDCQEEMERFTREQEDALQLLASLEELYFWSFDKLQHLPAGLHKLTRLKELWIVSCPAVRSLPKDGLPKSLEKLYVHMCGNEELKQQCKALVGTNLRVIRD